MNLILFTASYPYVRGGEQNFIDAEMCWTTKSFEYLVVVPELKETKDIYGELLSADVDDSYARLLESYSKFAIFLRGIFSILFIRGMIEKNFPFFSLKAWRRLIAFAGKAELTRQWVEDWFVRTGSLDHECLFYTYWFDHAAAGVGLVKERHPNIRLVTRAHNYDIYEERYYDPPFFPCRNFALKSVEQLFACSIDGADYMREKYPQFNAHYGTSFLGVRDPGFLTPASEDGVIRFVSCSFLRPEKRVSLLLDAVILASKKRPSLRMEWYHIGNGEGRDLLKRRADENLPSSAKATFINYIDNSELIHFYQKTSVDAFVNVSSTEGVPVSIMEAISCGIPVIATAVGGNVEIVFEKNGLLLNANPTPDEIADALLSVCDHREAWLKKRQGSREVWQERYNETTNFEAFAQKLVEIRKC